MKCTSACCITHRTTDIGKTGGVKKEVEGLDKGTTDGIDFGGESTV
jgi:hypothetical protein